ncbi:MAG: DUF3106 domain-containing protein [Candidatus Binatia bacterium]
MSPAINKIALASLLFSGIVSAWPVPAPGQTHISPRVHFERVDQSWYELSPREKSRALQNYKRFQKLSPQKKREIEERYNRWQQLPAEEQERLRRNYRRYRGMDSDEKEDFSRKYKRWRSRPND